MKIKDKGSGLYISWCFNFIWFDVNIFFLLGSERKAIVIKTASLKFYYHN